jgi:hypothetical protein
MKPVTTQIRRLSGVPALLALLVCLAVLGGCGGPEIGAEEQLRLWVSSGREAAEAKQRRELIDMISPAYVDARGRDRGEIEKMLRLYFLRQNNIHLLTSIEDIRLFGETAAEIDITVGMAGTSDGVLGFNADAYRFQFELEHDDDEWRLISARWGELGEEMH